MIKNDLTSVWMLALAVTQGKGRRVLPRGMETKELMSQTYIIDMRRPVLTCPERKLSYRYLAAEAYWILSGDNKVATIAPYNDNISKYSDDGQTFFGAYGPKIVDQLPYVVAKLHEDPMSRQAGLTIWREKPGVTKDVPCTVAMFFHIRDNLLHASVFMRSNDVWLGLPYDAFTFAMVAHLVCAHLNEDIGANLLSPGELHLTAASSHLYKENFTAATRCAGYGTNLPQRLTPSELFISPKMTLEYLKDLRETKPGSALRWWEL